MTTTELLSATELSAAIRAGEVSSVDAVTTQLRRIERVNPHIHAVVALSQTALTGGHLLFNEIAGQRFRPGPITGQQRHQVHEFR